MTDGGLGNRRRLRRTTYVDDRTWDLFGQFKAGIVGRRGEAAVADALAELGITTLSDVILLGERGPTQIDHLALTRGGIVVIETKTYGGHITGRPEDATWVQHLAEGEVTHAFLNPVWQNRLHIAVVTEVLGGADVPIVGLVVTAGRATFEPELRSHVVALSEIGRVIGQIEKRRPPPPAAVNAAWSKLEYCASAGESRREEHREAIGRRSDAALSRERGGA